MNNAIYEELGHLWWDDGAGFEITSLRYCLNPVRFAWFARELRRVGTPRGSLLDVGCGGGFLAEAFAASGWDVTGLDPSARTIRAARSHAAAGGLSIRYEVGTGEKLPFDQGSFAVVACCDVLEHVDEPERLLAEAARVLMPEGVLLYETVNRTFRSWLVMIKVWQDWDYLGCGQTDAHVWRNFIRPSELAQMAHRAGFDGGRTCGIGTSLPPRDMIRAMRRIRQGELRGPSVASAFALQETPDLGVSYMGWMRRTA